jgi:tRNA (guanine-N7-)-methyltransferase
MNTLKPICEFSPLRKSANSAGENTLHILPNHYLRALIMPKKKLQRFAEFKEFDKTFDFPYELKGKWKQEVFKNDHPLVLELGCGKGEYTVALGKHYPEKNFIGIDIKSNRMWRGALTAKEQGITNAGFIRMIINKIAEVFDKAEVDEIWITFPDPFPKDRHAKHRLTSPNFIKLYREVLKPGGIINFKTDDTPLFEYSLEVLKELNIEPQEVNWDVHNNQDSHPHLREIRTYYEHKFSAQGRTIKYLRYTL